MLSQRATGVRRETVAAYLRAAGIAFRAPGKWGRETLKPANEVIPESEPARAADPMPEPSSAKPAKEMITDFGVELADRAIPPPGRSPTFSACEPYREPIELALSRGRNAMAIWQDLVDDCGFTGGYAASGAAEDQRRNYSRTEPVDRGRN